jgi:hypothetical protein
VSSEAKIGLAVAVVALVAVLWFAAGPRPDDAHDAVGSKSTAARAAAREAGKGDRVKERLAQLRAERLAGGKPPAPGQNPFPGKLAAPAFDGQVPAPDAAVADEELDFETLRDMALIDEDPDNRIAAIWLLASLDDEEPVLPVLTQALSDEDPEVRMAAIQALSEFSEETPIDSLQMALQDHDAEIRFEALSIAAEMTDERVQPLIQQALDDPDEDVRSLAEGLADMEDTYEDAPTPAPTAGGAR